MSSRDPAAQQTAFFREILLADVAVSQGVLQASVAAARLARFWSDDDVSVLTEPSISPEDRARIESMVAEIVDQAGGDERAALAIRGVDRELPSQLEPETAHALSDSGARLRSPLRRLDDERYMGFLPIGEGGMGIVYLALDTELNRRVAFKMIRAGARDPLAHESGPVSDDAAARFVQEAVVTGGLEHPGIVPVYELGSTPAGVPYYTMRLVRGERTLATVISEAKTLEDRLNLLEPFLKVCDTVAYAHSRGVIHRDLKPANVALGPYGEVVVLDWGLAKMSSRPDMAGTRWQSRLKTLRDVTSLKTLTSALGTPGYMSPEAAHGQVDLVDERSDVYSLGAILYPLLTGESPFTFSNFSEYIAAVEGGVTQVPGAPAGLAKICVSALATRRSDRFPDVASLATAVRAWMTESTVEREVDGMATEAESALEGAEGLEGDALLRQLDRAIAIVAHIHGLRPDHPRASAVAQRARSLRDGAIAERESIARRRLMKRVGVAGLALAAAATVVVAVLLDGKRREAEGARSREAEQRSLAQAERGRAEEMAQFMLQDLHEGLGPIGRLDLLGTVAKKSLKYYEGLPEAELTDEVRASRAIALGQISEVLLATGDLAAALTAALESQRVLESLVASDPSNLEWQEELATAFNRTGDVQQENGDLDLALEVYRRSVATRRGLEPDKLARSLDRVGAVLMRQGDRAPALEAYEESLTIRRDVVEQSPGDTDALRALSLSVEYRGDLAFAAEGVEAALVWYEESLAIRRRLAEQLPGSNTASGDVAATVFRVARCRQDQGDLETARAHYEEALDLFSRRAALDPADIWLQRNVALSLEAIGGMMLDAGDAEGALVNYQRALDINRKRAARDPSNVRARHDVGKALMRVGDVAKGAGDAPGARVSYFEALEIARALVDEEPSNTEWQNDLADALYRMAQADRVAREFSGARASFLESLAVKQGLADLDPENTTWQRDVGLTLDQLASVAAEMGDDTTARERLAESAELKRALVALDRSNLTWMSDLSLVLARLGDAWNAVARPFKARAVYKESLPVNRDLVEASRTPGRLRALALALYHYGSLLGPAEDADEALIVLREAEAVHRSAAGYAGEHQFWMDALGGAALAAGPVTPRDYLAAAYVLFSQDDFEGAAEFFHESFAEDEIATDLVFGHSYNGACAAALSGQTERALEWLSRYLALCRESLPPETLSGVIEHARVGDADLASLRELPEFEQLFGED